MMLSLKFGKEDFCLITGFLFGKYNLDPKEEDHSEFRKRVFPKIDNLKDEHLLKLLNEDVKFNQLDDEDAVQGEYMWSFFHKRDYNVVADPKRTKYHLDKLASNSKYEANHVLFGFVFSLKIWALETFSNSIHWWRKDENVIPRGVAWSNGLKFEKSCYDKSSTRGSSNSKSVNTRVRTEVRHELHVRTEVCSFVHKEEVRTEAVDQEDLLERAVLAQTIKDQQQMIVDLQRHLLSVEKVTKKLRTGPSDVDHLDKNGNQYDNVPVSGLDHQSTDGVSQCMNVDRLDKNCNDVLDNFPVDGLDYQSMEGVRHCTSVNYFSQTVKEVDESVAIDGLIRLRSQDIDHTFKESFVVDDNDFKDKDNEEAYFLTTQQVRDLVEEIFIDTPSGPDSTQVKNVKDVVESDIKTVVVPFQRQKFPGKVDFSRGEDDFVVQMDFWEKLVGRSHAKRGWLSSDHLELWIDYLWQFKEPDDDWAMASPYLSDMLSRVNDAKVIKIVKDETADRV
nr:hypothetical protein [Tanacetum cinerariifolium]